MDIFKQTQGRPVGEDYTRTHGRVHVEAGFHVVSSVDTSGTVDVCHAIAQSVADHLQDFMIDEESPIREYYPNKFKLDAVAGCKNIYSEALLPDINIDNIRRVVANVPLDDRDVMRNNIVDTYFHKTFNSKSHAHVNS